MLGQQATGGGQAVADGRDGERAAVQHAEGGIGQAIDTLGVQVRAEQAAENVTNLVERELAGGGCHDMLRRILSMAAEQIRPGRGRRKAVQRKTQDLNVDAAIAILFGISNRADDSFIPTLRYPRNEGMLESVPGTTASLIIGLIVACCTLGSICKMTAPPRWLRPRIGGLSFSSVPRPGAACSLRHRAGRPVLPPRPVAPCARPRHKLRRSQLRLAVRRPVSAPRGHCADARSSPARPRCPNQAPRRSAGSRGSTPSGKGTAPTRATAGDGRPAPCAARQQSWPVALPHLKCSRVLVCCLT